MNDLKKRLANLLTIKSLVTLALTLLFSILAFRGNIPEEVSSVFYTVIGFYFGTQTTKETTTNKPTDEGKDDAK